MDKFGFDEVTSGARDVQQDAAGSLLTKGGMIDGTDSATARHEDEAKQNPNGTVDVIDRKGFSEILEDCSSKGTKLKTDDYSAEGKYAIVDQGQQIIAGYTDQEEGVYSDVPAIIFGDHTRVVKYIDVPFFLGADGTKLLKAKNTGANYKYLYYALKAAHIPNTGYNRHFKWVKELQFNYPSDEEQIKIVDQLDRLQLLIDKRNEQLNQLDTLIKARFVEMFGDTVNNTKGWNEERLDEYIEFLTSGSRGWSQYFTNEENEVFITIKNVKNNHIELDNSQYIKPPQNKEAERTKVRAGDLLISITADLGRTGVVDNVIAEKGAYINQHLSLVRLKQGNLLPLYLSHFLESDGGKRQFDSKNQTGVKAGLNFDAIKSLKVLVPPIELQNQFTDFVQATDKLKVEVQKSLDELQTLFDSLMQQYFG